MTVIPAIFQQKPPFGDKTYIFHLWADAEVEDSSEVTNKPSFGTTGVDISRRLPSSMRLKVKCSDFIQVPVKGASGIYQDTSKESQVNALRSLNGTVVTVTTRIATLTGIVRLTNVQDSGEWDNTVEAVVEIQGLPGAGDGVASKLRFGTISRIRIEIPGTAKDPGAPDLTGDVEMQNAPPKSGKCPNGRTGGVVKAVKDTVEDAKRGVGKVGKWFKKSFGKGSWLDRHVYHPTVLGFNILGAGTKKVADGVAEGTQTLLFGECR